MDKLEKPHLSGGQLKPPPGNFPGRGHAHREQVNPSPWHSSGEYR